jgi:hypothetical protein
MPHALNADVAASVWTSRPVEAYDSTPGSEKFTGRGFPCELELIEGALTTFSETLEFDSLFPVLDASNTLTHAVGILVSAHTDPLGPVTVLVFTVPRLARINAQGVVVPWGVFGVAAPTPTYGSPFPSVWLSTRIIVDSSSYSTFAHELGHMLAHPEPPSSWQDNDTPFLHIMTHRNTQKLTWDTSTVFSVTTVYADDQNRRKLVDVNGKSMCESAKSYSYVREVVLLQ